MSSLSYKIKRIKFSISLKNKNFITVCVLIKEGFVSLTVLYVFFENKLTLSLMLPARIIITSFICYFILVTLRRIRFGLRVTYHMSLWYLFLGKKKFLLGERACSADSAVFGLLAQIHWHSYGSEAENVYKSRWLICVVQFFFFAAGGNKYKIYIYCNRLIQCFEHIIKRKCSI